MARKVKIVCTLGPATAGVDKLVALINAGLDVARLNFSHGNHDSHRQMCHDLREAALKVGKPVAVLGDLCGPKIRIGKVRSGSIQLTEGRRVRLTPRDIVGDDELLPHSYPSLASDVKIGDPIMIDDGLLRLAVEAIDGEEVDCIVEAGGPLSDHKGLNLPQSELSVPALTDKDRGDVKLALELEVDYLALSFVRNAEDIEELKVLAPEIPVIAKIEKPEAVKNLDAILDAADGAMIARGDLGVEMGHERVPLIQKRIITAIRPRAKAVITATQMLESMIHNPTPTRAEVSDVANAVLDGTDAVMLSAETSVGKHAIAAVKMMDSIITEVEQNSTRNGKSPAGIVVDRSFSSMIAEAVASAIREFDLKAVAVYSESGRSARLVSAERPRASLIAFSRHERVLNRLALYWGVHPIHGDWVGGVARVVEQAERELLNHKLVQPGDDIAITFGMTLADEPFQTNILKLWKVREEGSGPLSE